jgi:hypothetical protein
MKFTDLLIGFLLGALLAAMFFPSRVRAEDLNVRTGVGFEVLHAQGYWNYDARLGYDGGVGLRVGQLRAPAWAHRIPAEITNTKPEWKLDSLNYVAAEKEWCDVSWCGTLGVAHLSEVTKINGTKTNFLLGLRYVASKTISLELLHFSHGSALGIEQDKSNSGWNLIRIVYTLR